MFFLDSIVDNKQKIDDIFFYFHFLASKCHFVTFIQINTYLVLILRLLINLGKWVMVRGTWY